MGSETEPKSHGAQAAVGCLAFVLMERVANSHDALHERWISFAGPVDPANPNTRYAVFAWDVYRQQWHRDGDGGFYDAGLARDHADQAHRELVAKWQLDDWPNLVSRFR